MSTIIKPGDIVQDAATGSTVIYEVVDIVGDYARVRPLWGKAEHTTKVGHLERMCDEQDPRFSLPAWHEYVAKFATHTHGVTDPGHHHTHTVAPQAFAPGDEVRVLDKRGLTLADTTFLDSRPVHIVQEIKQGQVVLVGSAWQFRADRFELVRVGANARPAPITIQVAGGGGGGPLNPLSNGGSQAAVGAIPVPDAKFAVGQVVEWDAPGTTEVVTALVQDAQWAGVAWLYGCEIIGGAKKGLVGRVLEHFLRESSGEVEHHKHHHHEKHKHVMGLDHDEIDPDAYREFMRSL